MSVLASERAFAKLNLCLFLGPTRDDGRHELLTLFDSVNLADELTIEQGTRDEVVCDAVPGLNLVFSALELLRQAGWDAPPVRVTIEKRIPVAAGMGGGSADAAAILRAAIRLAPVPRARLFRIAFALGADVPGQLLPGPSLGTGAGETIEPLVAIEPYGVLVLPQPFALSTAAVYNEADRLGLGRTASALDSRRTALRSAFPAIASGLVINDLQPAALSLAPAIGAALMAAAGAGADHVLVCGSGPTVIGVFVGADGLERANAAAGGLRDRLPAALAAAPVGAGVRAPAPND
ncbi:MAG: 4-(cytidine 5'-diphospho)-2-C-methyl-D-erythritol kinase [Solirubrobacteraceae bacterium]